MKRYVFLAFFSLAAVLATGLARAARTESESGRTIYLRFCTRCHGTDGRGSRYGKHLKRPVRDLRTNGLFFSNNELLTIITNHAPLWRSMPNERYELRAFSADETKETAAYIRTLRYAPDAKDGERIFKDRCALCHSSRGAAKGLWKAPDLGTLPLDARGIARAVRFGVHGSLMYPRESLRTNTEIADVVEYIQGLKKMTPPPGR